MSRERLRVVVTCEWFVKYTAGLARGLAEVGCEVILLTRDHDLEFGRVSGAMEEYVRGTLAGSATHLMLPGRVRDARALAQARRLRGMVRRFSPAVVHAQDSVVHDLRLAWIAGLRPSRYALTAHDIAAHPGDPVPGFRIATSRRMLRQKAALVFVHSEKLADDLRSAVPRVGPVTVVPHGVGSAMIAPLPEAPRLLFFGRISHYKGLDTLLEALPIVWERVGEARLTIAGRGPLPASDILGDPRVTVWNEHVPEDRVAELFAEASCVVLPYREASQSGVGSLARQHGRALVSTAVGGLSELVDPSAGRLVPPEDPAALGNAIAEVLTTPGLAAQMGRAASAWVNEAGWERVAQRTVDAYRRYGLATSA